MRAQSNMRIALLAHSTNPRGGVVHALELSDALTRLGHHAAVYAPDPDHKGFFRKSISETVSVDALDAPSDIAGMVKARIDDYVRHFENPDNRRFDIFHAQDSISGNALAQLKQRGLIERFARTVHHIDAFGDERLTEWQSRAIQEADELFVVSRLWQQRLLSDFGRRSTIVGNGVNAGKFQNVTNDRAQALRLRLGLQNGPVLLCIGGIEERKNTLRILAAFTQIQLLFPDAQLVIAGGASLLDHSSYRRAFNAALADCTAQQNVTILGSIADDDMPALYKMSDALVFPSVKEGFGLVVLEAMASGLPVVTSRIEPFTEYLHEDDVIWCDPLNVGSIANAIALSLTPAARARLSQSGLQIAQEYDWTRTARAHLPVYDRIMELQDA